MGSSRRCVAHSSKRSSQFTGLVSPVTYLLRSLLEAIAGRRQLGEHCSHSLHSAQNTLDRVDVGDTAQLHAGAVRLRPSEVTLHRWEDVAAVLEGRGRVSLDGFLGSHDDRCGIICYEEAFAWTVGGCAAQQSQLCLGPSAPPAFAGAAARQAAARWWRKHWSASWRRRPTA